MWGVCEVGLSDPAAAQQPRGVVARSGGLKVDEAVRVAAHAAIGVIGRLSLEPALFGRRPVTAACGLLHDLFNVGERRALAESPEERAAFLARSCGDDVALQQQVERLLASHRAAGSFLEKPPQEL